MESEYSVEPLGPQHNRAAFSCGVDELDTYIKKYASQDQRRYLAAVHVLRRVSEPATILGYYTLGGYAVEYTGLSPTMVKNLPRYDVLPAALIGRLTVDQRHQGQGFGKLLLIHAFEMVLRRQRDMAAMAIIVEAKDDASRAFYEKYGFLRMPDRPYRLVIPMTTVKRSLA